MTQPSSNASLLHLIWSTFSLISIPFMIGFVWIIPLPMPLKPSSWSSLQREILSQMLLLLSTISPLNVCLLQNFWASFFLPNSLGIFMLITFAKGPVRLLTSSTGLSILPPSIPATRYTLPWYVLSFNMPLPPGIPSI